MNKYKSKMSNILYEKHLHHKKDTHKITQTI